MALHVACPKCAASLVVEDGQAGWRVRCPSCMEVFVAGTGPATVAVGPQTPAAAASPPPVVSAAAPSPGYVPTPQTTPGSLTTAFQPTTGPIATLSPAGLDARPRCGLATASLVLGILALCCFGWLTAVPSVLCGFFAIKHCKERNLSGDGRAKLGIIFAVVALLSSKLDFDSPFPSKIWRFGEKAFHFNLGR